MVRHLLDASGLPSGNVEYSKCTVSSEDRPLIEEYYSSYILDAKLICRTFFRHVQSPSSNTANDSRSISRDLFSIDTGKPCYLPISSSGNPRLCCWLRSRHDNYSIDNSYTSPFSSLQKVLRGHWPRPQYKKFILQSNQRMITRMVITGKGGHELTKRLEYRSVKEAVNSL
jgi:hypothetical protein